MTKSETLNSYMSNARSDMQTLLEKCTPEQQAIFKRMYPKGPTEEQLDRALIQIERTLEKNKEKSDG